MREGGVTGGHERRRKRWKKRWGRNEGKGRRIEEEEIEGRKGLWQRMALQKDSQTDRQSDCKQTDRQIGQLADRLTD